MVLLRLHGGHGTLLCTHLVLQLYGDFVSTDRFQQVLIFVDRHGSFDHGKHCACSCVIPDSRRRKDCCKRISSLGIRQYRGMQHMV